MAIPIDTSFLRELIRHRWDSVDELAIGWADRCDARIQKAGRARDRATIYRWLKLGLPNRRDEVLGLCAALDVDPFVLVDLDSGAFSRLFERERLLFLLNRANASRLSALWSLVRPAPHWPDARVSHDYYARDWTTFDFVHRAEAAINVFALFRLCEPFGQADTDRNRTYYFAYRKLGATDGLWRPYGIVRQRGREAICLAEMGHIQKCELDDPDRVDVETFFGPGPAEFRVAALHQFEAEVVVPSQGTGALRFPA